MQKLRSVTMRLLKAVSAKRGILTGITPVDGAACMAALTKQLEHAGRKGLRPHVHTFVVVQHNLQDHMRVRGVGTLYTLLCCRTGFCHVRVPVTWLT